MAPVGINLVAVVLAAVAAFVFGGVWYGMLGRHWMAALGKTEAELTATGRSMAVLFALTLAAELGVALMLAGLLAHLGHVTLYGGVISAALLWAGLVFPVHLVNYGFQGAPWSLAMVDGGHWLGVLLVEGAILGWMGAA